MYEIYCKLRDEKGVKDATVAKMTGIGKSTFSDWKSGRSTPKRDKLYKIAKYFGVSVDVFMDDRKTLDFDLSKINEAIEKSASKESIDGTRWYFNDETAELAQEAYIDPEIRLLASAKKELPPEDFKLVIDMVKRFKETNKDG